MSKIVIAGSILVDKINEIKSYPNVGELTQIQSVKTAVGGQVPNVSIDIKKISNDIDVRAVGKIGNDGDGEFLKRELNENGVDVSGLKVDDKLSTSFTSVMSIVGGQRTFFTYAGACATFGEDDVVLDSTIDYLHLGYFLLLDKIDNGDGVKILKKAQEKGIKTSIDLVSENSDRYSLVVPCLKYVNNLIINETEGAKIVGIKDTIDLKTICEKLKALGVKDRVIIHCPEKAVCLSNDGYTELPSYKLPKDFILGTTGAGDAFCAGSLIGIMKGYCDMEILSLAQMSAVSALSKADAISGVRSMDSLLELVKDFRR